MAGDWNVTWDPRARINAMTTDYEKHYNGWHDWFGANEEDPFDNPYSMRRHPPTATLETARGSNDIDYLLGRRSFLLQTLKQVGVLKPVNEDDQRVDLSF